MGQARPFCSRLFAVLLSSPHLEVKVVEVIPFADEDVVVAENGNILEIGVTKRAYLAIFKEAHSFHRQELDQHASNIPAYLSSCSTERLREIYVCTIGYMLTTNENYTMVRVHELATFLLSERLADGGAFLLQELDVISSLVSSRLKRINKSPSLFLWLKYLLVQLVYADLGSTTELFKKVVARVLRASQLHYANYYASGLLRTLIRWNGVFLELHGGPAREINEHIFTELTVACRATLTDVSLWSTLEIYLLQQLGVEPDMEYITTDYNRAVEHLMELQNGPLTRMSLPKKGPQTPDASEKTLSFISSQVSWLLRVRCVAATPYVALLRPLVVLGVLHGSPAHHKFLATLGQMKAQSAPAAEQGPLSAVGSEKQAFFHALSAADKVLSSY